MNEPPEQKPAQKLELTLEQVHRIQNVCVIIIVAGVAILVWWATRH